MSKTLLETDTRAHLFRASTKAARASGTLGSCGRKDEDPVRRCAARPCPPLPGSRVVRVRTDRARREQGGEEMRHVVGPPEYAATQESRLRQEKHQDASVTTKTSPPPSHCSYEGAPRGLSYFTAMMLDHIFQSPFRVLGYFMLVITPCLRELGQCPAPGAAMKSGLSQGHKDHCCGFSPGADREMPGGGITVLRSRTLRQQPHTASSRNSKSVGSHQIRQTCAI